MELFRCQSCGERDALTIDESPDGFKIVCPSCGAESKTKATQDQAVEDWNQKNTL